MNRHSKVCYNVFHNSLTITVNSEIFARVLFLRNFAYAKFREENLREMKKSFCRLMIWVNYTQVANFQRYKYVF